MDTMNREIASYSLVSTLWNKYQKSYLDAFIPLLVTLLLKKEITTFKQDDLISISEGFLNEYGIDLPVHPLMIVVDKCRKAGIFRREHQVYRLVDDHSRQFDITSEIKLHLEKQEKVTTSFQIFAQEKFDIKLTKSEAGEMILETLEHNDLSILMLNTTHKTSDSSFVVSHKHKRFSHLVSHFIIDQHDYNQENFKNLVAISIGNIAAHAFFLTTNQWNDSSLKSCTFYIDAPLILKLIGCDGLESEKAVRMLFDFVIKQGGLLAIFQHNLDECTRNLCAASEWVESPNFDSLKANRTTLYLRQEGYTKESVDLLPIKLNRLLQDLSIKIEQNISPIGNEKYNIDISKFEADLEQCILQNDRSFEATRYKQRTGIDVDSIASIYILRQGKKTCHIRDAKYFFLTNNTAIIRADSQMACTQLGYKDDDLVASLSEMFLGTYIWASAPHVAKEYNKHHLLACAYSSIRPDALIENRLSTVAKGLITNKTIDSDDFVILTSSFLNKDLLSRKTLGDPDQINNVTVIEMLDEIRYKLLGEALDKNNDMTEALKVFETKAKADRELIDKNHNKLEAIAADRAKKTFIFKKFAVITLSVLVPLIPIIPTFFLTWYWIGATILSLLGQAYLSFFKGFLFPTYFQEMHSRELSKQRAKLDL